MSITGIRGINNHNPLNIKQGNDEWAGSVGKDDKSHAIFIDPVYSVRAAIRQLAQYQLRDGKQTLEAIFSTYAPADDNNDPNAYAAMVAMAINELPSRPIRLFFNDGHVKDKEKLYLLIDAMLQMECFHGYELPPETIRSGIALYERDFCGG